MHSTIKTQQGDAVLLDFEDLEKVAPYVWNKYPSCRYVQASINNKTTSIHRLVMDAPDGKSVDHINGDKLDNRKENLRFCSHWENMKNRKPNKDGQSQYKGVVVLPNGRFRAKIDSDGRRYGLGVYSSERDAVIAYNAAAKVLHGEFAYMNELPENKRPDQWLPIESAPRDGSTRLMTTPWGVMFVGYWYTPIMKEATEPCWRVVGTNKEAKPSHYMPLPKPPEQTS